MLATHAEAAYTIAHVQSHLGKDDYRYTSSSEMCLTTPLLCDVRSRYIQRSVSRITLLSLIYHVLLVALSYAALLNPTLAAQSNEQIRIKLLSNALQYSPMLLVMVL